MPDPNKRYVMPPAAVGECLWYYARDAEPMPALITKVGDSSVAVSIHAEDNNGHLTKGGVMHVDDPRALLMAGNTDGFWDYTAAQKRGMANDLAFIELVHRLDELEATAKELVGVLK